MNLSLLKIHCYSFFWVIGYLKGFVSPRMLSLQSCDQDHTCRSNAIIKNESKVNQRPFKRKRSSYKQQVKHDIQETCVSWQRLSKYWKNVFLYSMQSGWRVWVSLFGSLSCLLHSSILDCHTFIFFYPAASVCDEVCILDLGGDEIIHGELPNEENLILMHPLNVDESSTVDCMVSRIISEIAH